MSENRRIARRRLIAGGTALAGLGALALTPGRAAAWSSGPADVATERLYRSACTRNADHGRLAEQVRARLAGTMTPAAIDGALAAMRCPVCGCPLL
ncbi:MAG: hypothetical protein U1E53_11875 [Dongiaceae bacterium]